MKRILFVIILLVFSGYVFSQDIEDYCKISIGYGSINGRAIEGKLMPEAVEWYYISFGEDAYGIEFSTCDSDFNVEMQIWHGCRENERNFLYSNDNMGDCSITVDYLPEGTYYIRIYRNRDTFNDGNYKLLITQNQ